MKRLPFIIFLLFYHAVASSCQSLYVQNRQNDLADTVTVEVQSQSYGLSLRIGPLKAGMNYKSPEGYAGGLRSGQFGEYYSSEFTAFFIGSDHFSTDPIEYYVPLRPEDETDQEEIPDFENMDEAEREAALTEVLPAEMLADEPGEFDPALLMQAAQPSISVLRRKEYHARSPLGTTSKIHRTNDAFKNRSIRAPLHYQTQIEFTLGIYYGIKLGFNPGEMIDFVFGIFGIDLYADDAPYPTPALRELQNDPLWQFLDRETRREIEEQMSITPD